MNKAEYVFLKMYFTLFGEELLKRFAEDYTAYEISHKALAQNDATAKEVKPYLITAVKNTIEAINTDNTDTYIDDILSVSMYCFILYILAKEEATR